MLPSFSPIQGPFRSFGNGPYIEPRLFGTDGVYAYQKDEARAQRAGNLQIPCTDEKPSVRVVGVVFFFCF
jgi:hypothetical protein